LLCTTKQRSALPRTSSQRHSTTEKKMQFSIATVTIIGMSPYSASRQHNAPFLEGEAHDAYDLRTWREHLTTDIRDGQKTVCLPAHGVMQMYASAARYCKKQIKGQGRATWTKKFEAGISVPENPSLGIDPASVERVVISCNPQGIRGGKGRVPRRFPIIPVWGTTFDVWILDPIITREIFTEMSEIAGLYIGLGRFRPENGGINGRFRLDKLAWQDNRQFDMRQQFAQAAE
jgi:hypothetical protein